MPHAPPPLTVISGRDARMKRLMSEILWLWLNRATWVRGQAQLQLTSHHLCHLSASA